MTNITGVTSAHSRLALIPAAFHASPFIIQQRVSVLRKNSIWLRNCERMARESGNHADEEMYIRHAESAEMEINRMMPTVCNAVIHGVSDLEEMA
ncbi:MAG: hypothetical protein GX413_11145 [Acetobacter sp.]|nr:hypothetical protein [Acetobacter sp.]